MAAERRYGGCSEIGSFGNDAASRICLEDIGPDEQDLRILAEVQDAFPLVSRPFQELGQRLGMEEEEVLRRVSRLKDMGLIRRIGPILDLQRLGRRGVLVALKVRPEESCAASEVVNSYDEISHNYLRPSETGYNLWFTVSAPQERIVEILEEIRDRTGLPQMVLPTRRIFKIGVKFDIL
ncbi:MAG: hypothetical protein A4E47_00920 [Methanosaeta sp. PtaU1.Bin028]|nr:MAG: hypothetical protein A4E47_00920 [Methanosaeta sp. PtaU1.Bin028]